MKIGSDPLAQLVLTGLERQVIQAATRSLAEATATFRAQVEQLQVLNRSHSGVGFITRLSVPAGVPAVPAAQARRVGLVRARHPALGQPAEFVVQLKDGRLASIEAYCYAGTWPDDEAGFSFDADQRQ